LCLLSGAVSAADLKARCDQLFEYYEWFGTSRHENTDGGHNMTAIRARIDCDHGRYEQGIAQMEELLRRKKFTVPPAARETRAP
jgi:hypothetical protein